MRGKNRLTIVLVLLLVFLGISYVVSRKSKTEILSVKSGCSYLDESGEIDQGENIYVYNGKSFSIPSLAFENERIQVLGTTSGEKWIDVDLSDQKLYAWEGNNLFLETPVSTGLPWWPTPEGEFRIWLKLRATKMEGGTGKYYYNLPNVPYVMFFENEKVPNFRGYGLHGTYWHNDFGNPHSHGCVNLPTQMAEKLYYWTEPVVADGKWSARADGESIGTRILIHK